MNNYFREGYRNKAEEIYDLRESIKVHILVIVVCTLLCIVNLALYMTGQFFFAIVGIIFGILAFIFGIVLYYKILMLHSQGQELEALATMHTAELIEEETDNDDE